LTTQTTRIQTLDAVRGFAVMGILLLNIVDFGLPSYAYVDPNFYGGATGANWWAWAINYVLADGKMRGLFTMMFGASTVLIAERAVASGRSPARVHYARMAVLFGIGMIHAYLIWSGDILVLYAVCGAIIFVAWRWRIRVLLAVGVSLLALKLFIGLGSYAGLKSIEAAAQARDASPAALFQWAEARDAMTVPPETAQDELKAYRGNWQDAFEARVPASWEMQTEIMPEMLPDTLALMAIGMALFRLGFFSGQWSRRSYWRIAAAAVVIIPLYIPLVTWIDATRFSPVTLTATEAIHLALLRPILSLSWASLVILFMQSGAARWLADRLAATGRMAFSNYLGTSLVCTLIFNGYGLGWFGHLERWQLYGVVLAVWAAMLLWSKPWLDRFRYGPFEWLWRSISRMRLQPMRV
jgi:uncharacterized protein